MHGLTSTHFNVRTHYNAALAYLKGGFKIIQYREKGEHVTEIDMVRELMAIKAMCSAHDAIFIVNDSVDMAIASGADGVHLGRNDEPISSARARFKGIIGASPTTLEEAIEARDSGATYLGVGAMFPTGTKPDAKLVPQDVFREIRRKVDIPVLAIGGIGFQRMGLVKELGADGMAVISSVLSAGDPAAAAKLMLTEWQYFA
jgi:thiamine-phosphate pyrophosphorylase